MSDKAIFPAVHLLPRLYVAVPLTMGTHIALTPDQSHYLRHVLRREENSDIRVFNPADGEFLAKLIFAGKKDALLQISEGLRTPENNSLELHLYFSPLKKDKMDFLVEKAVELGVTHLHPILFQRSIVREIKDDRLQAQVIESAEQCERLDIPVLENLQPLSKAFLEKESSYPVLAALERGDYPLLKGIDFPKAGALGYLVGPEGGFTPDEIDFLLNIKNIRPVSLGPRILRSETAALLGLALLG